MDFLKKNIGLLLAAVVCLAILGTEVYFIIGYREKAEKAEAQRAEAQKWLKDNAGNKDKLRLGDEKNPAQAENNKNLAEGRFKEIMGELRRRYTYVEYSVDLPAPLNIQNRVKGNQADLKRILGNAVRAMKYLIDKPEGRLVWEAGPIGGYLADKAFSNAPIAESDFAGIYHLLDAYGKMLLLLNDSVLQYVDAEGLERKDKTTQILIHNLTFPTTLKRDERGEYYATPIQVKITSDTRTIQAFVNRLTNHNQMLFFIHSISFSAADPLNLFIRPEIRTFLKLGADNASQNRSGIPESFANPGQDPGVNDSAPAADGAQNTTRPADEVPEKDKRQNYELFGHPRRITAEIQFELIEYKPVEPEK